MGKDKEGNKDLSATQPLISVCIATYNQPVKLRRLLQDLAREMKPGIEIVIRDDSTNGESKKVCDEFETQLPIRYFHGERQGLDVAILFLTEQAQGGYVWWLGDEELLPGTVADIMSVIKNTPDISFIWLNSRNIRDEKEVAFRVNEDLLFRDANEALKMNVGQLGFISATIFRRADALGGLNSAKKYIGSAFLNLYIILYVLSGPGKKLLIAKPYLLCETKPAGEVRWYDQFQVFGISLFKIVSEFDGKFEHQAVRIALQKNLRQCIKAVLVERAMGFRTGFGSPLPKVSPMMRCYWSYWESWVAVPFLLLPRPVLKVLYRAYRKVFR